MTRAVTLTHGSGSGHRIAQPGSADLEYGPRVVGADLKRPEHRDLHTCIVPDSGSYARLARSG
jgi:hypothetical protein